MSSKADRSVAASNHEKNRKKLSRTISKVVKSLSSLDLDEKNDQLRILQKQLRTLDKQLVKTNGDEATIEKPGSKARTKKSKKENKHKESDDGGQPLGSYRLLPLGIGVKTQVKSKAVCSNLNNAVSRRTKTTLKEVSPKSSTKKASSQQKCSKLVSEYLAVEAGMNVANQKKSKKEKKKLKTLGELSNKMEKSSASGQKILNSIKVMEKSKKKSISETGSSDVQKISVSWRAKEIYPEKSEKMPKKSAKSSEPEGIKFSNFVSLSEQCYFLTAMKEVENEKCSTSIQSNILNARNSMKVMEKNSKKNKKKPISETGSLDAQKISTSSKVSEINPEKNKKAPKKPAKHSEPEGIKFSKFVSLSEQYYFLAAIEEVKNEKYFASNSSLQSNILNAKSTEVDNATKKPRKSKKKQNGSIEVPNDASINSVSAKTTNEISDIEIKFSKLTVSEHLNPHEMPASKKEKKKKKKKAEKALSSCASNLVENTAEEVSGTDFNSLSFENNTSTSVTSSAVESKENKDKKRKPKKKNKDLKQEEDSFENYLSEIEIFIGLRDGVLVSGQLRINVKDYNTAYVSSKHESESDYLIQGIRDRNRALEGDIVVLYVLPESMWKVTPAGVQKTAKVVHIQETIHSRKGIGTLRVMADKNPEFALFSPNDSRLPRWQVPMYCCPKDLYKNPSKYKNVYFEGILTNWITPKISHGFVTEILGEKGTIEAETMSLLCEADCDVTPIPQSLFEASLQGIVFDERILKNRQDLRAECIFSIDPEGAKDLDDAVSCKKLPNGNYEVGVHISDVSFYIQQGTHFDQLICRKATTVYLVQRAYHMLPQELCYLCSLTPGEDKLAFSVFWELTPSAEIISHRFTRSIIHSCVQLTYTHAQSVIDNPEATSYNFPPIMNGFSEKDCVERILQLHKLAAILRKKRFNNGCLRIEIPKLWFNLDSTGLPTDCSLYMQHESNWLIEELMLLANFTVGKHIYNTYPDIALLRQHKPPNGKALMELKQTLDKEEVFIDISSGATLFQSINQFNETDLESNAKRIVLSNLIAKPMPKALYYASGLTKEASDYWHFALNAGYYTHFTSPIRRYADIIVHRLLAASLGYCEKPAYTEQEIQKAASISNKQKYCAKKAGELSSKLFLTLYVAAHGPFIEKAAVLDIKDHSFDCVILRFGYIARVYTNNLTGEAKIAHQVEDGSLSIFVYWKENTQKNIKASIQLIKLFSVVTIELKKSENDVKLETKLLPFY